MTRTNNLSSLLLPLPLLLPLLLFPLLFFIAVPSDLELREGERRIRKKGKKKRKIFRHWFAKVKFHCCGVLMFLCGKKGKEKGKT